MPLATSTDQLAETLEAGALEPVCYSTSTLDRSVRPAVAVCRRLEEARPELDVKLHPDLRVSRDSVRSLD